MGAWPLSSRHTWRPLASRAWLARPGRRSSTSGSIAAAAWPRGPRRMTPPGRPEGRPRLPTAASQRDLDALALLLRPVHDLDVEVALHPVGDHADAVPP